MKTNAASKENNESCSIQTALGGESPRNDTPTKLGRGSVTARMNAAIGVYWRSIARAIELTYLLSAFGVLGGIPPLFDAAIAWARYLTKWMRRILPAITAFRRATSDNWALALTSAAAAVSSGKNWRVNTNDRAQLAHDDLCPWLQTRLHNGSGGLEGPRSRQSR
jgi:hypothetical protein